MLDLEELGLGATQLLGQGHAGAKDAVAAYTDRHGLRLHLLPRPPVAPDDVRRLLAAGRMRDAVRMIERPPIWRRPRSGLLRLAWRPGAYRAIAMSSPTGPPDGADFSAIHDLGLVYADLKPSNVIIDDSGGLHLVDFELTVPVAEGERIQVRPGTVGYMSPQQAHHG
jgi:hypothetical protein